MIEILIAVAVIFVVTSFLGHAVHWMLHQPWSGFMNQTHMEHHLKLYPPGKLVSQKYLTAGKRSGTVVFTIAFTPLLLIPIVLWALGHLALLTAALCLVEMIAFGLINDAIHDSFHLSRTKLRWLPGYKNLRRLHFIHHVDMTKNYGIFMFIWDRVFRTYHP